MSYILRNRNPKKLLILQKMKLLSPNSQKNNKIQPEKFLIFQEMDFSCPTKNLTKLFKKFLTSKKKKLSKIPLGETGCLSNH